ncbi:hypothetical protein BDN72DRAFT_766588 [Pluteus cervinus]|uniref:Uncharacterized protein n=1 Tax=Pluteus cervinus TaxID=181527 RepID=A0ACD3AX44_9AGAR|nr:hypothetical protein BDN72DRAFT_766588 [Pluteus cervinus]
MSHAASPSSENADNSAQPTPTASSHLNRTVSHASQYSATDAAWHHNQVASWVSAGFSPTIRQGPTPILIRSSSANSTTRRPHRSTSVSSSQATNRGFREDDPLSEEDEEEDEENHHRHHGKRKAAAVEVEGAGDGGEDDGERSHESEDDPITLRQRQSLINVQHPFGLPIWKPALYKKSRSVTRYADQALHLAPSAQAERHLLPGNLFWVVAFGWWLALVCFAISAVLYVIPRGGRQYASLVFGLGWYLGWPFGKYVEGVLDGTDSFMEEEESTDGNTVRGASPVPAEEDNQTPTAAAAATSATTAGVSLSQYPTIVPGSDTPYPRAGAQESTSLLQPGETLAPLKSYGATQAAELATDATKEDGVSHFLGQACFWLAFICIIAPLMLIVCLICWALVVTIPMAKLNWALVKHIFAQPTTIRFCAAPPTVVMAPSVQAPDNGERVDAEGAQHLPTLAIKTTRISAGQAAPSGGPKSTVLLCTYKGTGLQYYKYTVGGVNILFVNLLPVVFFVIFDGFVLLPMVEDMKHKHQDIPAVLELLASQGLIFVLSLLSVIPLSYFIGMAVASISAQSSIGMGAVINATFGSIIEILLYAIALTQGKGHLVEGSIVGSVLAGVLLMPGMSMCSSALRRKEQKFNAKSASVTSMMLIMAIIGALTPTLFYQTYGNFQLVCTGCPTANPGNAPWTCDHCYYKHPDPVSDPFYQSTVKSLMYFCATILLFSYLIGLWFSLRTHATQIWQNPQQLLHHMDLPIHNRLSIYQKLIPSFPIGPNAHRSQSLPRKPSLVVPHPDALNRDLVSPLTSPLDSARPSQSSNLSTSPLFPKRVSYAHGQPPIAPIMEGVDSTGKPNIQNLELPPSITRDDFNRAVEIATALHPSRVRTSSAADPEAGQGGGHGGHDAPSWSRTTSASVLLVCTALYAVIAELLVDVVDVVLAGSGVDEKFLGVTLFALVPNTTEFMNAISFALNGNIALSMEIGSAYALQVCLLQIPAMVAFSAWYDPEHMGEVARTFTLIFPRWDVVVIILSMFLLTYTYIEAKSNYHRGSILILSYLVLTAGFYFAPPTDVDVDQGHFQDGAQEFPALSILQSLKWYLPWL